MPATASHYATGISLLCIQVSTYTLYKIAVKTDGSYAFSPSASLACSEAIKLLVVIALHCRHLWAEPKSRGLPSQREEGESSPFLSDTRREGPGDASHTLQLNDLCGDGPGKAVLLDTRSRFQHLASDRWTLAAAIHLALLYACTNHASFTVLQLLQLTSITSIRAALLLIICSTLISEIRSLYPVWVITFCQLTSTIFAAVATAPDTYDWSWSWPLLILIIQVPVSAACDAYYRHQEQESIIRRSRCGFSLGFFAAGTVINLVIHLVFVYATPDGPSFGTVFDSWPAVALTLGNSIIGLLSALLHRNADAPVKLGFEVASLGILLSALPLASTTATGYASRTYLVPGLVTVVAAILLLVVARQSSPRLPEFVSEQEVAAKLTVPCRSDGLKRGTIQLEKGPLLTIPTLLTLLTTACLWMLGSHIYLAVARLTSPPPSAPSSVVLMNPVPTPLIESPLKDAMAFVRWNQAIPERVPVIQEYRPFFKALHISMPRECADAAEQRKTSAALAAHERAVAKYAKARGRKKVHPAKRDPAQQGHSSLVDDEDEGDEDEGDEDAPVASEGGSTGPDVVRPGQAQSGRKTFVQEQKHRKQPGTVKTGPKNPKKMQNPRPPHRAVDHPPRIDCSVPMEPLFNTVYRDNFDDTMFIYKGLADTMQLLLDAPQGSPEQSIGGVFFFHFDAWIDPMGFSTDNLEKIWFPLKNGPIFECLTTWEQGWWAFREPWYQQDVLPSAIREAIARYPPHIQRRMDPKEWCSGWSDIYYVPRRFFEDWIDLSNIMLKHDVVHEIAIPTMLHIIDIAHRTNMVNSNEIITFISDCWGACCRKHPSPRELLWYRCGHKLDLSNHSLARVFYDRLDAHASLLGTPLVVENEYPGPDSFPHTNATDVS